MTPRPRSGPCSRPAGSILGAAPPTICGLLPAAGLARSRVDEALAEVGLSDAAGRRAGKFSLGMRQRLGLAGALLARPQVLVLDEPGNGLDPEGIRWLRGFLRRYAEQGGTVLVSSHALAEVSQTVDRVVIMARGRLVAHSTLDELTRSGESLEDVFLNLTASGVAGLGAGEAS